LIFDQSVDIPAPAMTVWEFLMDIPAVSTCVPGVESFEAIDEDTYAGVLRISVGPIGAKLHGRVVVTERDSNNLRLRLQVSAADKRIASTVSADATMTLVPRDERETRLQIHTEVSILGKLGSFGQTVIRRKADQLMDEFAQNLTRELTSK